MSQHLELNILFSLGLGILQSYEIHRVVIWLFFQPVFWGRGLPCYFSGNPAWASWGDGLSGNRFSVCLLFPGGFPYLFWGSEQKWPTPKPVAQSRKKCSPLSLISHQKQSPLLCAPPKPQSPSVRAHGNSLRGSPGALESHCPLLF